METKKGDSNDEIGLTDSPVRTLFSIERLKRATAGAGSYLLSLQSPAGHWVFDVEADCTITAEYVLLQRFLGRVIPAERAKRLANHLRRKQLPAGGWPIYEGAPAELSASTKAYFALKLLGDSPEAPHMVLARRAILSLGGAAGCNVFTRITLALFGQIPWRTVPAMPIEIMFTPSWFFFHLNKVSYWSRTVIVPLLILFNKRPTCPLDDREGVRELFLTPPEGLRNLERFIPGKPIRNLFLCLDRFLKRIDRFVPRITRKRALARAVAWTRERMQGEGGLGAIFPAMANAVMAMKILGCPDDDPLFVRGMTALDQLLVRHGEEEFCQPCVSPIWDTCLSLSALAEGGLEPDHPSVSAAREWLFSKQILSPGDWSWKAVGLEPGAWAFQFENSFYPDVDDTSAVLTSIFRAGGLTEDRYRERIERGVRWILGMQGSDGGWGAFDSDNNAVYLNNIPFADHGALLDPSTSDLTGRCLELLSMYGFPRDYPPLARALEFLRKNQEPFGGWFGRWGVNYIYGTWSVMMGLRQAGEDLNQPYIRKAVEWLKSCQNPDHGWGETCQSYADPSFAGRGKSTASQTAWALLALMAAGEHNSPAVQRGIHYLLSTQNSRGGWDEDLYTGTGFPRVFYLRYHGYGEYFPFWAMAVYSRLRAGKRTRQDEVRLRYRDLLLGGKRRT